MAEVADAADVSRRTAYRYFPTQEQLLTEVSLEHLRPQVEAALKAAAGRRSPAEVLDAAVTSMQRIAIEHDALLRTIVRLSLEKRLGGQQTDIHESLPVRGSRRVEWIEIALAPVRPLLAASLFERLVSGLTLCLGIESLITLQDVRTLSPDQAVEICRWAAQGDVGGRRCANRMERDQRAGGRAAGGRMQVLLDEATGPRPWGRFAASPKPCDCSR